VLDLQPAGGEAGMTIVFDAYDVFVEFGHLTADLFTSSSFVCFGNKILSLRVTLMFYQGDDGWVGFAP